MQEVLLSIIVPVYNTEEYMDRCIQSIIGQTYKNIELILVDDGSTDASGDICNNYAQKDKRIKVFHKNNEGSVLARNYGIQRASGEVVTFVDSDDWIEPDMYEQIMQAYSVSYPDLISTGCTLDKGEKKAIGYEFDLFEAGIYKKAEIREKIVPVMMWNEKYERRSICAAVWNKFFKKELLLKIIEDLDGNISLGDDAAIVYPYIVVADSVQIINYSWYHYEDRENSLTKKWSFSEFNKIYCFEQYMEKKFLELGLLDIMEYQIKRYTKTFLRPLVQAVYGCNMEEIRYIFPYELLQKNSKVIIYGAGVVGKSYWNCLKNGEYAEVVSWVDRKHGYIMGGQVLLENPMEVAKKEFDSIVIAIEKEALAEEIRTYLLELGVKSDQIIWKKPQVVG